MTLLLPWFPIILAVGVGGRLLGRARGLGLGILCALFWIVLVQASAGDTASVQGATFWAQPWNIITVLAGAIAIAAMGRWAGEMPTEEPETESVPSTTGETRHGAHLTRSPRKWAKDRAERRASENPLVADSVPLQEGYAPGVLEQLCAAIDQFDDWLHEHRDDSNPWQKFDEFIRTVLYQCCQATHVKPYRLLNEEEELVPLCEPDPLTDTQPVSARRGILGHVVTTGRPYLAGDPAQGELVCRLAEESNEASAWCFAIRQGSRRFGIVVVGRLGLSGDHHRQRLNIMERLVNQFWVTLVETMTGRSAVQVDPVSGLSTRATFLRTAEESLRASYAQAEPVALVVIALEGLRDMNDSGRWEVADDLVREVCNVLRRKVRMEDRLGRFDGSRIILLLRRVDSELASLIVNQVASRVMAVCTTGQAQLAGTQPPCKGSQRWGTTVMVRCGVTGSGTDQPTLRTLVSRALIQCRRARLEDSLIASDFEAEKPAQPKQPPSGGAKSLAGGVSPLAEELSPLQGS